MSIVDRIRFLREGGHVRRCHVIPHIGEYDNARHSWHAAVLLIELWPEYTRRALHYILYHDVTERWTGDIPATSKWMFPDVAEGAKLAEHALEDKLDIIGKRDLSTGELRWVKAVDMLELYYWCHDQMALGNKNVHGLAENIDNWASDNKKYIPDVVYEILTRTMILGPQDRSTDKPLREEQF